MKHIWIREEYRTNERRVAIVPRDAAFLLKQGYKVTVENYNLRAFPIEQYRNVGCEIVESGTWKQAPKDIYILGIKELPISHESICGKHIYFSHSFKNQPHAKGLLKCFHQGGGYLYDLEYFTDSQEKQIVSTGYHAGICALAMGIEIWCKTKLGMKNDTLNSTYYLKFEELIKNLKFLLNKPRILPKILIIGAKGRCGQGSNALIKELNLDCTNFGRKETQDLGYVNSALEQHDIIINCISTDQNHTQPLITYETRLQNNTIIFDLTCEPYAKYNPITIYDKLTTFNYPVRKIILNNKSVYLSAIDHVPSYLPIESSNLFSSQLMLLFASDNNDLYWRNAEIAFLKSISELSQNEPIPK